MVLISRMPFSTQFRESRGFSRGAPGATPRRGQAALFGGCQEAFGSVRSDESWLTGLVSDWRRLRSISVTRAQASKNVMPVAIAKPLSAFPDESGSTMRMEVALSRAWRLRPQPARSKEPESPSYLTDMGRRCRVSGEVAQEFQGLLNQVQWP